MHDETRNVHKRLLENHTSRGTDHEDNTNISEEESVVHDLYSPLASVEWTLMNSRIP
jgi:hypothetical protein